MPGTPADNSAYHHSRTATPSKALVSPEHARMLFEESAISPAVAEARGYRTVRSRSEVPDAFKDYQRRLGLLIPTLSPSGRTGYQLRPDKPRRDGPKYEAPTGSEIMLDVSPLMLEEVRAGDGALWISEGAKKIDALASCGEAAISLSGVWNFAVPGTRSREPLSCWQHVRLEGRRVIVVFDADARTNANVQKALRRLVALLEGMKARVSTVYLPAVRGDCRAGADDFLAAGGTVEELRAMARPFEPVDVTRERMNRDGKLAATIAELRRTWRELPARTAGECSARDVFLIYAQEAARSGKVHPDGIRVKLAQGTAALRARVSRRTLWKSLNRLEEASVLYRDNADRKRDQAGAVVLRAAPRATVSQKGGNEVPEGKVTPLLRAFDPGDLQLRAPRLMWSSPGSRPRRGVVAGTRKVREGPLPAPRPAVKRLGKARGAILDVLDLYAGTATLAEIAAAMGRKRPRDIRRRLLPWLEETKIIEVDGDTVSLTPAWLDRLEELRRLGGEIEAEEVGHRELATRREAFREHRRRSRKRPAPSPASVAAVERSHRRREAEMMAQARPIAELGPVPAVGLGLLEALGRYLDTNPGDHPDRHPPDERRMRVSLVASSLWALELLPEKPPRAEVETALDMLAGVAA